MQNKGEKISDHVLVLVINITEYIGKMAYVKRDLGEY